VPDGMKGNIFPLSKRESGIFFVCYQLSCFLSTARGHDVAKSGKLCQAIILKTIFLILL
jgi:hypothetical protein